MRRIKQNIKWNREESYISHTHDISNPDTVSWNAVWRLSGGGFVDWKSMTCKWDGTYGILKERFPNEGKPVEESWRSAVRAWLVRWTDEGKRIRARDPIASHPGSVIAHVAGKRFRLQNRQTGARRIGPIIIPRLLELGSLTVPRATVKCAS